jgi:hypothetical protein
MHREKQLTIADIPLEILSKIFSFCIGADPQSPPQLGLVTKRWYELLYTSPLLWQRVTLDEHMRSFHALQAQAQLWFARSNPLLFDIELNIGNTDNILPLISYCLQQFDRWRSCSITIRDSRISFLRQPLFHTLELLEVSTHNYELQSGDDIFPLMNSPVVSLGYIDSLLRMAVELHNFSSLNPITPMRFRCLNITEYHADTPLSPRSILQFLQALPELEEFSFEGWKEEPLLSDITGYMPVARLHRLTVLSVCSTFSTRALLSNLDCPNLCRLCLRSLNREQWKLLHVNNFSEDGDSDDEAQDFSRSPVSFASLSQCY